MSDHVIITGVKRAKVFVPVAELKQMAGRIGRVQNGLSYSADIILNDEDFEMESMLSKNESYNADSKMNEIQKFASHLIPEIVQERVKTKVDLEDFYKKSFAFFQNKDIKADKVLEYLISREAISIYSDTIYPSETAKIASSFYMHVGDVKLLRDNFKRVIESDIDSDGACAWALGNLETIKVHGDFGDHREEIGRFEEDLPSDYDCEAGTKITSALWWCMMGNGVPGKLMANNVRQLKKHWGRINQVLEILNIDKDYLRDLNTRIKRNINKELLPFFYTDPNMTKDRARGLLWLGYNNAIDTQDIELED